MSDVKTIEELYGTTGTLPKRPRRTAVEAAKARLEAAQKREQLTLLKKARTHLEQALSLIVGAGDVDIAGDEHDESCAGLLQRMLDGIAEELAK